MENLDFLNNNQKNVAFIVLKKKQGEQFSLNIRGTGLLTEGKKIISCAHIYDEISSTDRGDIYCGIMDSSESISKVRAYRIIPMEESPVKTDKENDLIIFEIIDYANVLDEKEGFKRSDFLDTDAINSIKAGEDIYFSGFSLANELMSLGMGITLTTDKCVISNIKYRADSSTNFILVDKQINPGGSGSPVFYKSKIAGIASGTLNRPYNTSTAIVQVPVGIGIVRSSNYILKILE
jgi:hypothetical protein